MSFEDLSTNARINNNIKRIVDLIPTINAYVAKIDMGTSVYNTEELEECIRRLQYVLTQIDADLTALADILSD